MIQGVPIVPVTAYSRTTHEARGAVVHYPVPSVMSLIRDRRGWWAQRRTWWRKPPRIRPMGRYAMLVGGIAVMTVIR